MDVLDILMLLKYLSTIYFEHCVMMSNYVIVVYVSSDPGTYMVHIRFAFQKLGVTLGWAMDEPRHELCVVQPCRLACGMQVQSTRMVVDGELTEWDKAIWLATDGGGVNIIYPDTHDIQILSTLPDTKDPELNPVQSIHLFHFHIIP